jgi:ATP-dependent DNA helicase RecG
VVGTHSALAGDLALPKLGLAVVDEQHRFGVIQRLEARGKSERPHLLALSATPIPRSLALALFGDLKMTRLLGRPSGRPSPPASTADAATAFASLRAAVARGERAFVIFPSIRAESAPALEREGRALVRRGGPLAGLKVAWLHGALPAAEREASFEAFRTGAASVLVATTLVEVGIDVSEATVMVVVGAERFGLATLHQLRGRVGRGERPGLVHLVVGGTPAEIPRDALERLRRLEEDEDGFRLAEADLALRGPGEICGLRQHGHGGLLPLAAGRDRGFLDAVIFAAEELAARGYDSAIDGYYGRLAAALGGAAFDPPDAL